MRHFVSPIVCAFATAVALTAGACANEEIGDPHPTDKLSYPVSVTADPSGRIVWVASGNFDFGYRGGAVLAIDTVDNTFIPDAAFEVGSLPGAFHLLERDGRAVAGYILSRDTDALYAVSMDPERPPQLPGVRCVDGIRRRAGDGVTILQCRTSGALDEAEVRDADGKTAQLVVGPDPFGATIRHARSPREPDLLLTGAMLDGNVASLALAEDGTPELVGNLDLLSGIFDLAVSPTDGRVYATNKSANVIQVLDVVVPESEDDPDLANPYLRLTDQFVIPESLAFDRARAVTVSADGTRMYASYRSPDTLVVIDLAADASGDPAHRVIHKIPVSKDPGELVVVPGPTPGSERVYVACFGADRVEVVDPDLGVVVDSIRTGRGPFGIAAVDRPDLGLSRLYVSHFYEDSVGVVERDPASPFYHQLVAEVR